MLIYNNTVNVVLKQIKQTENCNMENICKSKLECSQIKKLNSISNVKITLQDLKYDKNFYMPISKNAHLFIKYLNNWCIICIVSFVISDKGIISNDEFTAKNISLINSKNIYNCLLSDKHGSNFKIINIYYFKEKLKTFFFIICNLLNNTNDLILSITYDNDVKIECELFTKTHKLINA